MRNINLVRWSVVIVLVCIGAGIFEAGLFVWFVNNNNPSWSLAFAVGAVGILTSAICAVAGVVGVIQKPTVGIPALGVVIGVIGLLLTLFIEALSRLPAG